MIGYVDTSAVVPLIIHEPSSDRCVDLWMRCDIRLSSVIVVAEAMAAIAMAHRLDRLTDQQHAQACDLLEAQLDEFTFITPTLTIARAAGRLADDHGLRGNDAIHLASALAVNEPHLVMISGDRVLLEAAAVANLATIDTNQAI
ncbi:MAG: type II toxin-antitoxin system VapC family toxin [Propionibacteriaceae bacterium]|jgi:predicted nucleic acid-binding protein|nr:type II toxin-antitoxin system VapC family toxin [Propionibacteriaceae bacterium]